MPRLTLLVMLVLITGGCTGDDGMRITSATKVKMRLSSPAFENKGEIPAKYTCDGEDINPQLDIAGVPSKALSLVLIIDDPDAPSGTWDHWIVYDIPPTDRIEENSVPGKQGMNSFNRLAYGGPCPPSGSHRYYFRLYALDNALNLPEGTPRREVEKAMKGHVIGEAELMGRYSRKK